MHPEVKVFSSHLGCVVCLFLWFFGGRNWIELLFWVCHRCFDPQSKMAVALSLETVKCKTVKTQPGKLCKHDRFYACPAGYVLIALISLFFFCINICAKRTQDLLDRFSPNFYHMVYLILDCRFNPFFKGMLPWQPILWSKLAKLEYSLLFIVLAFRNGLQYCHSDFKKIIQVCKFGELWSINSGVYEGEKCAPCRFFSFFKINISDKLCQDPLDQFSLNFHHMVLFIIKSYTRYK